MGEGLTRQELDAAHCWEAADRVPGRPAMTEFRRRLRYHQAVMWLEHLLLLSMLQHVGGTWTWGRYVVVHPAGNTDVADACARYRTLLADSTFSSVTLDDVLASDVLPRRPS